ncbi:hypothetical protein Tco_0687612 [Tanacetum coccineum]
MKGDYVPLLPAMLAGAAVDQGNTLGSAKDSMQLKELTGAYVTYLGGQGLIVWRKIALKRKSKKVLISESEGEESKDQGRKIHDIDDDPLVSLVRESMKEKSTDFVTLIKALGEAQEEEISPTISEAAKTLSKVASQCVSKQSLWAAVDQGEGLVQPAEPHHTPVDPISSTSQPPIPSPSPPHSPLHHSSPQPLPHFSPPRSYEAPLPKGNTSRSAENSVQLKELMVLVPKLVTRINSLETELKDIKQTLGNVVLTLVKKVKSLETVLKRKSKKVLISGSEGEESEDQGRKF